MASPDVTAALIAAGTAERTAIIALGGVLLTAIVTLLSTLWTQASSRKTQRELAQLTAAIATKKAEADALRDYEYEARKRLYVECEPVLLRLGEASENALHRVYSLARSARRGDILPTGAGWLAGPGYYLTSTVYNLLVPLVHFRLLQERLSLVDLSVDPRITEQYVLAKWFGIAFTDDFTLAQFPPIRPYRPYDATAVTARTIEPSEFWRQGLPLGRLEIAVEAMIEREGKSPARCMSFGRFESAFEFDLATGGKTFNALADVFTGFHPATRPVLWRVLVVQAFLHAAMLRSFSSRGMTGFISPIPDGFAQGEAADKLVWSDSPTDAQATREAIAVASDYLHTRVPAALQHVTASTT